MLFLEHHAPSTDPAIVSQVAESVEYGQNMAKKLVCRGSMNWLHRNYHDHYKILLFRRNFKSSAQSVWSSIRNSPCLHQNNWEARASHICWKQFNLKNIVCYQEEYLWSNKSITWFPPKTRSWQLYNKGDLSKSFFTYC